MRVFDCLHALDFLFLAQKERIDGDIQTAISPTHYSEKPMQYEKMGKEGRKINLSVLCLFGQFMALKKRRDCRKALFLSPICFPHSWKHKSKFAKFLHKSSSTEDIFI